MTAFNHTISPVLVVVVLLLWTFILSPHRGCGLQHDVFAFMHRPVGDCRLWVSVHDHAGRSQPQRLSTAFLIFPLYFIHSL